MKIFKNRLFRILMTGLATLSLISIGAFIIWANIGGEPMPEALDAMKSTDQVEVTIDELITFIPKSGSVATGLILYPGGRVDAEAYAPIAQAIAIEGYTVVIVPMPLRLAFFGINRGTQAQERYPEIQRWVVGGHSLGGVAASIFARRKPEIHGLLLMASIPSDSLVARGDLGVLSLYGTNDGLISPAEIEASRTLLPICSEFIPIEGGNHAQFGWYGSQKGDNEATISRSEQHQQIIAHIATFLQE